VVGEIGEQLRFELGGVTWTDAAWDVLEHDTDLVFQLNGLHLIEAVGGNGVWVSGRRYKGTALVVLTVTDKRLTTVMTLDEWQKERFEWSARGSVALSMP
jgi:hypothetical protein